MHTTEAQGSQYLPCGFSRLSLMAPELNVQDLPEDEATSKPRVGIELGSMREGKAAIISPEGSRIQPSQFGIRLRFPHFPKKPVLQTTSVIRAKRARITVPVEDIEAAVPDVRYTSIWDIFKRFNVVRMGPRSTISATDPTRTHNLDHRNQSGAFAEREVIDPDVVIPLLEQEIIAHGGNAEVYKVRIHEDHHKFSPDRGKQFALKRISRSQIVTNPNHESTVLEELAKVPRPHLTPILTLWSQSESYNVLLPLANENLHTLIRKKPWPKLDGPHVIWLLQQMSGLAAALDHIHNLVPSDLGPTNEARGVNGDRSNSGYHHDLHPHNILVFDNVLKISDFGTAGLQQDIGSGPTNECSHQTSRVLCHVDYEAPDYDRTKKASRPHDVWALGCIFLEMLVWASGKGGDVDKFYDDRLFAEETKSRQVLDASFWYERGGQYQLKAVVKRRITTLKYQHDTFVFKTLIKVVEGMLRIEIEPRVPNARHSIATVRSILEKLIAMSNYDDETHFSSLGSPAFPTTQRHTSLHPALRSVSPRRGQHGLNGVHLSTTFEYKVGQL